MKIDIRSLTVDENVTFKDAFKITSRTLRTAFVLDKNHRFCGIITDGDIRRALMTSAKMEDPIKNYYNRDPVFIKDGKLNKQDVNPEEVYIIPVLNTDDRVIDYKTPKDLRRVAFVSGITGQDGAYLAYFLVKKGYTVVGGYRRTSNCSFEKLKRLNILDKIRLENFDITDLSSIMRIIEKCEPREIYNLAAQTFVQISFDEPYSTSMYTGLSVINFLEAIRLTDPSIKFYQASSSEMFGNTDQPKQSENTVFRPASPYAVAKLFGHLSTKNYRNSYNMFCASGILFNHESPLRGLEFVTRKITYNAAQIKLGLSKELRIGNLKAKRDWGYAYDYVKSMWLMLQQDEPDDYVIGTGRAYSVEQFIQKTFEYLNLDYKKYLTIDETYFRPADIECLTSHPEKAIKKLGWNPDVTLLDKLIKIMVDADLDYLQNKSEVKVEN